MIQIGTDFDGFPVEAMTVKEILLKLGFKTEGNKFSIDKNAEILNAYPMACKNDGMAYPTNPEFLVNVDKTVSDKKVKEVCYEVGSDKKLDISIIIKDTVIPAFNIFTDVPENKTEEDDEY